MSDVRFGEVKWFNDAEGFGYVTEEGGSAQMVINRQLEWKFHKENLNETGITTYAGGQKVTFNTHEVDGQVEATNIKAR